MNVLFLSLLKFSSFEDRNIYTDLLRQFIERGINVFAVCPAERRLKEKTNLKRIGTSAILTIKTFNVQKTSIFEKGIGTLAIKRQFIKGIKKWLKGIKFDLILYPTPPITLCGVVEFYKKRDSAKTYLMLKDIFPQNAVDIGLLKTKGLSSPIYNFFRKQEKRLYSISDRIGCMSQANVDYLTEHNPEIGKGKIEIFPNCIDVRDNKLTTTEKKQIRDRYRLPTDKKIFVYGGNLGKPQGIPFLLDCLNSEKDNNEVYFLIIGDGTEYHKLEDYLISTGQKNLKIIKRLPTGEFDKVVASCDVGMIFLDHRFTIPNFPSRLLSYMQAHLPVLACTDEASDVGRVIVDGDFGWWCISNDAREFCKTVRTACDEMDEKANNSFPYLVTNFSTRRNYGKILFYEELQ